MSRLTLFRVGFLFLILFFTTTAKAQKEAETFNVDSTLYEYYQRCQEYLLEPVVLNMSDTLFRMVRRTAGRTNAGSSHSHSTGLLLFPGNQ